MKVTMIAHLLLIIHFSLSFTNLMGYLLNPRLFIFISPLISDIWALLTVFITILTVKSLYLTVLTVFFPTILLF